MKIDHLFVQSFLGIQALDIQTSTPITLICGPNGAGKSSCRDGIKLALTADLGRVSLKKDAGQLVRTGDSQAICEVRDADGDTWAVTISAAGKIADSQKGRQTDPTLAYVLDAQRFAQLDATERRAFLFGLMGVKLDGAAVAAKLAERGCDTAKAARIAPMLRAGFQAAAEDAKAQATAAKGAWRAVTGETFGSEKAKTWKAAVPPYDAAALAQLGTELQHLDVAIGQWQESAGKLVAEESRRAQLRSMLPALREAAAVEARKAEKLEYDRSGLQAADHMLAQAQAAAGGAPRVGLVHDLARAVAFFLLAEIDGEEPDADVEAAKAALAAYVSAHGSLDTGAAGDPDARARLPELQRQLNLMQSAVANAERDLTAARAAKQRAADIDAELAEVFDAAALADARTKVDELKAARGAKTAELDKLKSIKALAEAADEKTLKAGELAADVAAWDALGDALGPDGLPAQLLAEALGPLNERLAQHAADTEWMHIRVTPEMQIEMVQRGREYRLLSESERWRCDAMLAEAISHISGARLLVLDRADVLDLQGRGELLGWLDVLAEAGEVDSALVFATLKALPAGLPETIEAHWIEGGTVGAMAELYAGEVTA